MIRLHPVQEKLLRKTLTSLPEGVNIMIGAPEVLRLNQILMRSVGAKKAIDVGVFTGMSALTAALVLPDDGKVLACDVEEKYALIGMNGSTSLKQFTVYFLLDLYQASRSGRKLECLIKST